ncbi:hypothetical protein CBS101457_006079 [Exobasidium rhododendri]|nr:hypothetical protein CBS101457_006079 [Exobasidium rhododendri]
MGHPLPRTQSELFNLEGFSLVDYDVGRQAHSMEGVSQYGSATYPYNSMNAHNFHPATLSGDHLQAAGLAYVHEASSSGKRSSPTQTDAQAHSKQSRKSLIQQHQHASQAGYSMPYCIDDLVSIARPSPMMHQDQVVFPPDFVSDSPHIPQHSRHSTFTAVQHNDRSAAAATGEMNSPTHISMLQHRKEMTRWDNKYKKMKSLLEQKLATMTEQHQNEVQMLRGQIGVYEDLLQQREAQIDNHLDTHLRLKEARSKLHNTLRKMRASPLVGPSSQEEPNSYAAAAAPQAAATAGYASAAGAKSSDVNIALLHTDERGNYHPFPAAAASFNPFSQEQVPVPPNPYPYQSAASSSTPRSQARPDPRRKNKHVPSNP